MDGWNERKWGDFASLVWLSSGMICVFYCPIFCVMMLLCGAALHVKLMP